VILVRPCERHLEMMAGHSLVNDQRPRVPRARQLEITDVCRWMRDIPKSVLIQPVRTGQIVRHAEMPERLQEGGQRQVLVMLHPRWNCEQVLVLQELPDLVFVLGLARDLSSLVRKQRQLRQALCALLCHRFKCDGPLPLLASNYKKELRRERHKGDVIEEITRAFAADRGTVRHRRQRTLQPARESFERVARLLRSTHDLAPGLNGKHRLESCGRITQPGANILQYLERRTGKRPDRMPGQISLTLLD